MLIMELMIIISTKNKKENLRNRNNLSPDKNNLLERNVIQYIFATEK